jgi:hypothetical protein
VKTITAHKNHHMFGLCVKNRGYTASLETRKIYQLLSDAKAESRGMVRVVDESGDDYLYPESFFVFRRRQVDCSCIPPNTRMQLTAAGSSFCFRMRSLRPRQLIRRPLARQCEGFDGATRQVRWIR